MQRKHLRLGACIAGVLMIFYLAFVHYQEPNEVAIVWNKFSGKFWLEKQAGFHVTPPWVFAAKIDTRPVRVSIASASRSFNKKLVQFNPEAYREFVAVEGTRYYWWSNRISINFGYEDEHRGMKDILRGYAYGLQSYPFITVVRDYGESE